MQLWSKWGRVHPLRSHTWEAHSYGAASENWLMKISRSWILPIMFQFGMIPAIFRQSQSPSKHSVRVHSSEVMRMMLELRFATTNFWDTWCIQISDMEKCIQGEEVPTLKDVWDITGIGPSKPLESEVQLGVVAHTCNLSTWEAEAGGFLSSSLACYA